MRATAIWMRTAFSEVPRKWRDLKGLLDPAEEQLDGPAALVEVGDLLGGGIEVVAEDAQHLAALGLDPDLAYGVAHGVAPAPGLAGGQEADAVGEDRACLGQRQFPSQGQRRVGLEAGDDAAAGGVELGPPAIIVIAKVENVGGAGLDRHGLGGRDVVVVLRLTAA